MARQLLFNEYVYTRHALKIPYFTVSKVTYFVVAAISMFWQKTQTKKSINTKWPLIWVELHQNYIICNETAPHDNVTVPIGTLGDGFLVRALLVEILLLFMALNQLGWSWGQSNAIAPRYARCNGITWTPRPSLIDWVPWTAAISRLEGSPRLPLLGSLLLL